MVIEQPMSFSGTFILFRLLQYLALVEFHVWHKIRDLNMFLITRLNYHI